MPSAQRQRVDARSTCWLMSLRRRGRQLPITHGSGHEVCEVDGRRRLDGIRPNTVTGVGHL